MFENFKSLFSLVVLVLLFFSCRKDTKDDTPPSSEFDRKAMLENIGSNVIIPSYIIFQANIYSLEEATVAFINTSDSSNLIALQDAFIKAYHSWQACSAFEFGPAEEELLRLNLNTFPTDTTQIKSNITTGLYDLATASNIDAKGFPALDYLLFGHNNSTSEILLSYTTDVNFLNRKNYLTAVVNEIKIKIETVYNSWISSGGNYLNTFTNNTGTDVGSSIGALVNQLNYDTEFLRNAQIGIPLGKKTLGTPLPEKVEAYYSGISAELILKHFNAIENIFLGRDTTGVDGLGLDDYLTHLNAKYNGASLTEAIKNQFSITKSKLELIADPLSETIISNPTVVDDAYIEIQKTVILLKTDMPSAMGVLITYQDNDGD